MPYIEKSFLQFWCLHGPQNFVSKFDQVRPFLVIHRVVVVFCHFSAVYDFDAVRSSSTPIIRPRQAEAALELLRRKWKVDQIKKKRFLDSSTFYSLVTIFQPLRLPPDLSPSFNIASKCGLGATSHILFVVCKQHTTPNYKICSRMSTEDDDNFLSVCGNPWPG